MINFNKLTNLALAYINANEEKIQSKHVSIIIHKKSILSIKSNSLIKTHPFQNGYKSIYQHSEVAAFAALDRSYLVNNCKLILINFRFNAKNELSIAKPCGFCSSWVRKYFSQIYYSNDNKQFERF